MMKSDDSGSIFQGGVLSSRGPLAPGTAAGAYIVTEFIARGGCGSVYRARHREQPQDAAVKVLHGALVTVPKMVERFAREAQLVNLLRHPHIVEIFEIGSLPDGRPFYVMEYLQGRTLAKILEEQGRIAPSEVLTFLAPVCAALDAAHAAGVIHRDVKASNIMVGDGEPPTVKLLDFGIAKLVGPQGGPAGLTTAGRYVGTITIMAPEQLLGGPVDSRIDIYALGILLFRMLTGRLPFDGKSPHVLAQQHLEEPAPRPSQRIPLPPALDAIVLRCLEKRPEHRYDTVRDFLVALRRALSTESPQRDTPSSVLSMGFALYIEIRLRSQADDLDETTSEIIGQILDTTEEALPDAGFLLASVTGSGVLGVRPLSNDPAQALREREEAIALAASIHDRLIRWPDADSRVHVNVCVHVDEVTLSGPTQSEVSGGPLVCTDRWVAHEDVDALCATRQAIEGLSFYDVSPRPDSLFAVKPLDR